MASRSGSLSAATPLYVLWQDEFGFTKSTLTAVFCCYMAGMALALLVAGVTSDRLGRKAVLVPAPVAGTIACVATLVVAVDASSVAGLTVAAVLAGAAYGPGMLGGLALLNADIPAGRLAEANAALNIGAYAFAGLLILALGFLGDRLGFAAGVTLFALVAATVALAGGSLVVAGLRAGRQ
ncbi:MFS transporter [Nocardia zapadnayensis]|uniref:MFS transporter n=1 Tax=Nocardia rhamnosiphila TaxID=426716 RepID=UPI0022459364|nr:MFS transporter [Nocardia zapadnayensis]MCX0271536.1 MFS transporter [Nocardia zapadnayensis]